MFKVIENTHLFDFVSKKLLVCGVIQEKPKVITLVKMILTNVITFHLMTKNTIK